MQSYFDLPQDHEPIKGKFGKLSPKQELQLLKVPDVHYLSLQLFPCDVILKNGEEMSCVYIAEASSFLHITGQLPEEVIPILDVEEILNSRYRIPSELARLIYNNGESGMGYFTFQLVFSDGTAQDYLTGDFIDFVGVPPGKKINDVVKAVPHVGYSNFNNRDGNTQYHICLFEK